MDQLARSDRNVYQQRRDVRKQTPIAVEFEDCVQVFFHYSAQQWKLILLHGKELMRRLMICSVSSEHGETTQERQAGRLITLCAELHNYGSKS
jgi:hypothetical protein